MADRLSLLKLTAILSLFLCFPNPAFAETVSEEWMEVSMLGSKVGFMYQKVEKNRSGYKLISKTHMKFEVQGTVQDISSSQTFFLDENLKTKRFSYMQKMLNHRQFFEGVVRGNEIDITVESGGNVSRRKQPFPESAYLSDAMNLILGKKSIKTGDEYSFDVFVIPLLATKRISSKVGPKIPYSYEGKKEEVFIVTTRLENMEVVSYITADGRLMKEESAMGFMSIATDEARATSFGEGVMPFTNLLTYSLIPVESPIENKEQISSLELRLSGLDRADLVPQDSRQSFKVIGETEKDGKRLFILEGVIKKNDAKSVPSVSRQASAKGFGKYLAGTIEAQSDSPEIIRAARKIVGSEKDAWKSAVKINRWVHQKVKKRFVDTFSAVETLKTLEGECQSDTNLFTALARASGIPARTISGIVYSEQYNGFLYHAWPEVFVGSWVALDPTFGQDVADATHIKLIEGDLSSQLELFSYIGKLGIEVISEERE